MEWFEPRNFKEWRNRTFGLRAFLLTLLFAGLFFSELRFDWVERALGDYLVKTNAARPESGTIWDIGHRKLTAEKTLEKIITARMSSRREAQDAATLAQIAENISDTTGGVMFSPDHFKSLYLRMPPAIAHEIFDPLELLRVFNDKRWDRTYFEKTGPDLTVYLLDRENRVLHQLEVSSDLLYQLNQQEVARTGTLDTLVKFENRSYPADRFFAALEDLPEEARRNILPQPEVLLKTPGRISRVGISDEVAAGFVELGFEFESGDQRSIIFLQGRDWAVWMLRAGLAGKDLPVDRFNP